MSSPPHVLTFLFLSPSSQALAQHTLTFLESFRWSLTDLPSPLLTYF